jgi:hypothetical protein
MALSLNKPKLDNLAGDIWKSAERLRDKFKAYEYQSVILPIIVIRRLECVLLAWREAKSAEVLARRPKLTDTELAKLVKELELNPQQSPFSNKTEWTLRRVYEEDHTLLEENFRDYINGFSRNIDDIIEHFNYRATITLMVKNNRLAPILNQYKELELGPDQFTGLEMSYIYEELLRRFSEQSGEEAGEHFTPRQVIRLMVELLEIPIPDQSAIITETYEKAFTAANLAKEQIFHNSDLTFRVRIKADNKEKTLEFVLKPTDSAAKKFKTALGDRPEILSVEWTHRHYVQDDEYIPHGEDIAAFLKREIAKPIIRWADSPQLGYEILPNKYFYRYQPPTPAKDLLAEFWKLEKEVEKMLEGLTR